MQISDPEDPDVETDRAGPYPTKVGKQAYVVTAYWGSRWLGALDTVWSEGKKGMYKLKSISGTPVLLGGANSPNNVRDNTEVAAKIAKLKVKIDAVNNEVVGESNVRGECHH
jgi:hypothetical protein